MIGNQVSDARYKLASRLSNKLLKLNKTTLIVTESAQHSEVLCRWLWECNGTSFVNHEAANSPDTHLSNLHYADCSMIDQSVMQNGYQVIVNLCDTTPRIAYTAERVVEIIEASEDAKQKGRIRYQQYQKQGMEINTHQLEI